MEQRAQSTSSPSAAAAAVSDELAAFLSGLDDALDEQLAFEPLGAAGWVADNAASKDEWMSEWPPLPTIDLKLSDSNGDDSNKAGDEAAGTVELASEQTAKVVRQNALAARRRKVHRAKKKKELHELQDAVVALTARRDTMKARRDASVDLLTRLRSETKFVRGWRGIAMRQLQRKLEAEALNQSLRAQVSANRLLARQLEGVLRMRLNSMDTNRVAKLSSLAHKTAVHVDDSDLRVLATFMNEMNALHEQTDDVFRSCNRSIDSTALSNSWFACNWDLNPTNGYIEAQESMMFPFELRDTVRAMHKALPKIFGIDCVPVLLSVPDAENTLAVKFAYDYRDVLQRGSQSPLYQCVTVVKIFDERDRAVSVTRSLIVERDTGLKYIETSWTIVRPTITADGSAGTALHSFYRIQPLGSATTPVLVNQDGHLGKYLDMTAQRAEDDALELAQAIENVILDDQKVS